MRRRGKEIKNDESAGMSTTPIGPAMEASLGM